MPTEKTLRSGRGDQRESPVVKRFSGLTRGLLPRRGAASGKVRTRSPTETAIACYPLLVTGLELTRSRRKEVRDHAFP